MGRRAPWKGGRNRKGGAKLTIHFCNPLREAPSQGASPIVPGSVGSPVPDWFIALPQENATLFP